MKHYIINFWKTYEIVNLRSITPKKLQNRKFYVDFRTEKFPDVIFFVEIGMPVAV